MKARRVKIRNIFSGWLRRCAGLAAVEFALIFPLLMAFLVGVFDYGTAFVINQKAITASQMMADLVARNVTLTDEEISDIVAAGFQTMRPFPTQPYGYDIVSIRYDGNNADDVQPYICWRRTANMTADDRPIVNAQPIALLGEGMVIVTVTYLYRPALTWRYFGAIDMSETAFSRGRRSAVVSLQEGIRIGCEDEI